MSNVRKFLDLTTAHLPQHLMDTLNAQHGVIAYPTEFGGLMYVPDQADIHIAIHDAADEKATEYTPLEIIRIWQHAHNLGCAYVLFDRDGPRDPSLPTWEW